MKRIPEIDGLRGIAILLVVSFHYINNQLLETSSKVGLFIAKATYFGWVGVDLFFVLSGFLIGSILLKNKSSINYFKTFYLRRIVRIIPNYYLLLVIYFLIVVSGYFKNDHNLTGNNVIPLWSYFLMIHNFFMAQLNNLGNGSIDITWSIGIEEQFYILIPFVLYKLNNKFLPWVLLLIIISANFLRFQYENWIPQYVLLGCRADSIAFGLFLALLFVENKIEKISYKKLLLGLLIISIVSSLIYYQYGDFGIFKHTLFAIIFSILILLALTKKNFLYTKILRSPILKWVGSISYSLYLFHYLILHLVQFSFGRHGINSLYDVGITVLAFFISLLFSFAIYKYLEKPMVNIGKKFNF